MPRLTRLVCGVLIGVLTAGCSALTVESGPPQVECVDIDPDQCEEAWRTFVKGFGAQYADAMWENQIDRVRVVGRSCTEAIDVWFRVPIDGITGLTTEGGLC